MKKHNITNDSTVAEKGRFSELLRKLLGHDSALDLIPKLPNYPERVSEGTEERYAQFLRTTKCNEVNRDTFHQENKIIRDLNIATLDFEKAKSEVVLNDIETMKVAEMTLITQKLNEVKETLNLLDDLIKGAATDE